MSQQFSPAHIDSIAAFERGTESDTAIAKRLGVSRQLVSRWHVQHRNGAGSNVNPYLTDGRSPAALDPLAPAPATGHPNQFSTPEHAQAWTTKTAIAVRAIETAGVSRKAAFAIAGIPSATGYLRMETDEVFREAIIGAEAKLEFEIAHNLKRLATGDQQQAFLASATMLGRRFPKDWSERRQVDVDVSGRIESVNISAILSSPETILAVSKAERLMQQDHSAQQLAAHEEIEDAEYRDVEPPRL